MGTRREPRPSEAAHARTDDAPVNAGTTVVQRKLMVGDANDSFEHEADRVASEVVQRLSSPAAATADPSGTAVRRSVQGSAAEAFAAPPEVESAIARTRGKGSSLEPGVRSQFEGALGADLGSVRVHTDDHADQLNRAVSAKAFTTGNDVYFSKGTYQPDSRDGQHLLAHELTHTIQQTGGAQRTAIQRLTVNNTDFAKTRTINVEQGGSSGMVATFSDGGSETVVLKAGQSFGNEMVTAASLHGAMGAMGSKKGESGGFKGRAPEARLATPDEISLIQAIAPNLIQGDPRNFLTGLSSGQVMISKGMSGKKVMDVVKTTTDPDKTGQVNPDSLIGSLLTEKGALKVLGQHAVVDVIMGMFDRMIGLTNPENFMYDADTQTFAFVDNVKDGDSSSLVSKDTQGGFQSSRGSFLSWTTENYTKALKGGTLGDLLFTKLFNPQDGLGVDIRGKAQDDFNATVTKSKGKLTSALKAGVKEGQSNMKKILANPAAVAGGIADPTYKREMVTSLLARKFVALDNMDPSKAWEKAALMANDLVKVPQTVDTTKASPPVPPTPPTGGGGGGRGNGPTIGGHRGGGGGGGGGDGRGAVRIGGHRGG